MVLRTVADIAALASSHGPLELNLLAIAQPGDGAPRSQSIQSLHALEPLQLSWGPSSPSSSSFSAPSSTSSKYASFLQWGPITSSGQPKFSSANKPRNRVVPTNVARTDPEVSPRGPGMSAAQPVEKVLPVAKDPCLPHRSVVREKWGYKTNYCINQAGRDNQDVARQKMEGNNGEALKIGHHRRRRKPSQVGGSIERDIEQSVPGGKLLVVLPNPKSYDFLGSLPESMIRS